MSLRDSILNADDIKTEPLFIEEWNVTVEVRALTGKKRAQLLTVSMGKDGKMDFEKLYPEIVISSTYDPETKKQVFEQADRDLLNGKSGGALEKVAQVAMRLSGLSEKSSEVAEKNLEPIQKEDSTLN